jgi:hypothetical protein
MPEIFRPQKPTLGIGLQTQRSERQVGLTHSVIDPIDHTIPLAFEEESCS